MSSALTRHTARAVEGGGRAVSWLPARLDGSERKLLLDQIARAYPAVVEAGFALLAEQRAESAERRRKNGRRREHDRRRRRLAELGDDG